MSGGIFVDHENDTSIPPPTQEEALGNLLHCHEPIMSIFPMEYRQIQSAGKLDYTYNEDLLDKDDDGNAMHHFEYAEHAILGNTLVLQWHDGKKYLGKDKIFKLPNGLEVTYGQINALGGDFFGSEQPICKGDNLDEQIRRFHEGYSTLAVDASGKKDAEQLISLKRQEVELLNGAVVSGESPAEVYKEKVSGRTDDLVAGLQGIISSRPKGYLGLALINFDHFGKDAREAYNAGHTAALRLAASNKDAKTLEDAYAMNAFADHFLEDSFAAGHVRVPRQKLHGTGIRIDIDMCARYMHDEDNKVGLHVTNPKGESWTMYGDTMLLEKADQDNLRICHAALMASTQEIFDAWSSGTVPSPSTFGAWQHAPIISSAFSSDNHSPLFNEEGCPRDDINDRNCKTYKSSWGLWTYPGLLYDLKKSPNF